MNRHRRYILEWAQAGHLAPTKLRRALEVAEVVPDRTRWRAFLSALLLWLGAAMLVAAAVFFFAYNWQNITRHTKFALAEGLIVAALAAVAWLDLDRVTGKAALVAAALFTGALFALIGQTYQTGADTFELFAAWAVAILPWALLARFPPLWLLWLAIANLAAVLYAEAFPGAFDLVRSPSERQLWLVFGVNTVALTVWETLALGGVTWLRERWAARVIAAASGTCITALAVRDIIGTDDVGWALPTWIAWIGVAYVVYRRRIKDVFILAGGVLSCVVVVTAFFFIPRGGGAFRLFLVAAVVIALSAAGGAWLKKVAEEGVSAPMVNVTKTPK